MENINVENFLKYVKDLVLDYLPDLAAAIVTLIIGWWIIGQVNKWCNRLLVARKVEASVVPFISSLVNFGLKILLLISVASMVGIATTSFVAILGAAGLAVGLALQGSLANFAGGVLILLFKPFKVGDLIESDGVLGEVKSITVLNTTLTTPTDNTAVLPNGQVANNKVINYTRESNRRVDLVVGVGYGEDIEKVKEVLEEAMKSVPKVLDTPAPFVGILDFGDSSVNLAVRPFCKSVDYWDVYFGGNEAIKKALDANNIEIPFPQRVVEIKK
ncbi:MAG: mechanosensitive ion channel protein [Bacteroidetes bacterium]|nr:MAG: mechanosensitive ion channel protein [Bacteroidota bacterium]